MKDIILKLSNFATAKLGEQIFKSYKSNLGNLSSASNIKNGGTYFNTLCWALNNRKTNNLRNIALTGPYESGRSDILQSFQKVNTNKDLHFLNISLSTFNEEEKFEEKIAGENLQQQIELTFLQQLLYRKKGGKLPDSRLKKIFYFFRIKHPSLFQKPVLNHNLEKIIHFFEVTDYNVIIIEDLDHIQETEIFTKLREINWLINNSKKINKEVVFIYAIRNDMFIVKDGAKFFDFIIPIISVIDTSNYNEIPLKEIKTITSEVSDGLINDISLFIEDMGELHNLINELQVYKQQLNKELSQEKSLSTPVCKNISPDGLVKPDNYDDKQSIGLLQSAAIHQSRFFAFTFYRKSSGK
jgi:hypothetical protein